MTFRVETKKRIAIDSPDHLCPVGCVNDNFSSPGLIDEVIQYFGGRKITALDLGCAGGQFVVDFINRGQDAIGLDGSSHVLLGSGKENWEKYFNTNLFLCDLTEEYQLYENDVPLEVDYIHSEEVFEHIHPDKLDIFLQQIRKHLKDDGICSFGISLVDDIRVVGKTTYTLHQSVFPSEWWKNKLIENGFEIVEGGLNDSNHFGYIFNHRVRVEAGESSCYVCCKKAETKKKVFIDCGANRGQGLREFIKMFNIDSSWVVESYEPNAECNLAENILEFPFAKAFTKAVWSHTGKVSFSKTIVTETNNDEGSSINGLNVYAVENHPQEMIEVDCIDISDILNKYSDEDYIVLKIDVEGAEYEIVRKMIKDGTINKVDELFVEWHSRYGVVGETAETENQLKEEIQKYKVKLHDWY